MVSATVFVASILAVIVLLEVRHYLASWEWAQERAELLNRIMARDLPEYQSSLNRSGPPKGRNWMRKQMEKESGQKE